MSEIAPVQSQSPTPEQALVQIGDITVSRSWLSTPAGAVPLAGTTFMITDLSRTETRIPPWAIVFAIIGFFFFLLGLLFLLVRETQTFGSVQVVVQNGRLVHSTSVPVRSHAAIADTHHRVAYARQVVAAAG